MFHELFVTFVDDFLVLHAWTSFNERLLLVVLDFLGLSHTEIETIDSSSVCIL